MGNRIEFNDPVRKKVSRADLETELSAVRKKQSDKERSVLWHKDPVAAGIAQALLISEYFDATCRELKGNLARSEAELEALRRLSPADISGVAQRIADVEEKINKIFDEYAELEEKLGMEKVREIIGGASSDERARAESLIKKNRVLIDSVKHPRIEEN